MGENVMMFLPDASPNASPDSYWQIYSVSAASSFSMDHVGSEIKEEESWEMPNSFYLASYKSRGWWVLYFIYKFYLYKYVCKYTLYILD